MYKISSAFCPLKLLTERHEGVQPRCSSDLMRFHGDLQQITDWLALMWKMPLKQLSVCVCLKAKWIKWRANIQNKTLQALNCNRISRKYDQSNFCFPDVCKQQRTKMAATNNRKITATTSHDDTLLLSNVVCKAHDIKLHVYDRTATKTPRHQL